MTEQQLEALIEKIGSYDHVDMQSLGEDLLYRYLSNYRKLSRPCKRAWEESASRRLASIVGRYPADRARLQQLAGEVRAATSPTGLRIWFGQMRVGANFQGSTSQDQETIPDFPTDDVVGRPVNVVAGSLTEGEIRPDQIPVQVFWSAQHNVWVAVNNRGYAAHCEAKVQPLRIWPREPTQKESNRLSETIDYGSVSYAPGFTGHKRGTGSRELPSEEILVTNMDSLPFDVLRIVEVPATWG